eukprot:GILK01006584.1.p1 GENE.GILK01006584.1~~GILK01006584.1.p1  ORF type:complete len:465 (-),score=62.34 GILK01006584.1:104-1498(-)
MSAPSSTALVNVSSTLAMAAPPPRPKKRPLKVLEEDTYVKEVRDIIERDFFPDLPRLRAALEYLQAQESHDVELLSRARQKLRDLSATPNGTNALPTPVRKLIGTPSALATPGMSSKLLKDGASADEEVSIATKPLSTGLSLDKFQAKYTSEDNASFETIYTAEQEDKAKRQFWFQESQTRLALMASNNEGRPTNVDTWKFQARNSLMFVPEGELPLAIPTQQPVAMGPPKIIKHDNTRFSSAALKEIESARSGDAAPTLPELQSSLQMLKGGTPLRVGEGLQQVRGYNLVSTPSPAPGVDASPLITWGDIEGTPILLGLDTSYVPGQPQFTLQEPARKDMLGKDLADQVAKKQREKKTEAIQRARSALTPARQGLSAAQKAVLKRSGGGGVGGVSGKNMDIDTQLRASYRTPMLDRSAATPIRTPAAVPKAIATPSLTPVNRSAKRSRTGVSSTGKAKDSSWE